MSLTPIAPEAEGDNPPPSPSIRTRIFRAVRELCAIGFWLYALLKIFVIDVDMYIVSHTFPKKSWVLDYKFLFFVSAIAIVALFLSKWTAIWFVSYIVIYPLIVIFWRLPFFIFKKKSWFLLFHIINVVGSFIRTFRHRVIALAVFLIAFVACLVAQNNLVLLASISVLCLVLVYTLIRILIDSVRPQPLFGFYKRCFSYLGSEVINRSLRPQIEQIKGVSVAAMTDDQLKIYKTNLGASVLANRVLLFVGKKLRDYQRSAVGVIGSVLVFFSMWLFTVICFAAINSAIYRMNASAFSVEIEPSAFTWFRYAFYTFFYAGIPGVTPVDLLSQAVEMLEAICALLVVGVFLSVLTVARGQMYSMQLDDLIKDAERESYQAEMFINAEFGLPSIDAAIAELERLKYESLSFLLMITRNL